MILDYGRRILPVVGIALLLLASTASASASAPQVSQSVFPQGTYKDLIVVESGHAFVHAGKSIQIFDVKDPLHPTQVGAVASPGSSWSDFDVVGTRLYGVVQEISGRYPDGGLYIFDVSDPAQPIRLSLYQPSPYVEFVRAGPSLVHMGTRQSTSVNLIDVSDPRNPYLLTYYDEYMRPWDLQLAGNLAYVLHGSQSSNTSYWISAFDMSDPEQPQQVVDMSALTDHSQIFAVNSEYLYVYTLEYVEDGDFQYHRESALRIIDVSEPKHPRLINTIDMSDFILQLRIHEDKLYEVLAFSDPKSGQPRSAIVVLDVNDPSYVTELARYYSYSSSFDIDVQGDCIYATQFEEAELTVFCTAVTSLPTSTPTLTATPGPSATPPLTSTSTAPPTPEATVSSTATLPVPPTSTATATATGPLPTYLPLVLTT